MVKEAGASLSPSTYVEGGGLLNDVNVKWKECRFELWDYQRTQPNAVPALKVTMEVEDMEEPVDQYFSAGSTRDWMPSKDGKKLMSVGVARGINKTSNLAILINSLIEAEFPPERIEEDCTVFEGLECHMVRVKAPERKGLAPRAPRADGKTYEPTNLVVDSIIKFPWDRVSATGKAASSEDDEGDLSEKARSLIMEILEKNPKGLDKKKLASVVFNALKTDPDRNEIVKMIYNEEFLKEGPWDFAKGIVGMYNPSSSKDDDIPF